MWSQVGLRKHHYEQREERWWNSSWALSNPRRWCCESAALNMPANLENSAVATGLKHQFSFQFQRKAMPKNVQTTTQLHSFHMLVKWCSKFSKPGFSNMWTVNFQMFNLVLEKQRTRDQIANIRWIIKKAREFQKNNIFCFINYAKAFEYVDHNKLENSERYGHTRPPDLPLENPICRSGSNS